MTVFDEFNEIKRKGLPQILVIFGKGVANYERTNYFF